MILVCEFITPSGLERLKLGRWPVVYDPQLFRDRAALKEVLAQATALVVRNQTQVDADLLDTAPRLRVVGRLGVGLDNINQPELQKRGVSLYFARGINATGVAEYVLAALFHFSRHLEAASASVARGEWNRAAFGGFELRGKTLGLVGLGEVGLRVASRAQALGLRVLASDPQRLPWESAVEDLGLSLIPTPELLAASNFISLHAPLTPQTRHLIRAETLATVPAGAYLINTARGELVSNDDLAAALRTGRLAGAMLDVTDPEPLPTDHVLRGVPNLWITPHIAGLTAEAQEAVGLRVAEGVLGLLEQA